VAARIRRELRTDVEMIHGRFGELQVLVDQVLVIDGGSLAMLGVLPSVRRIVASVRDALAKPAV